MPGTRPTRVELKNKLEYAEAILSDYAEASTAAEQFLALVEGLPETDDTAIDGRVRAVLHRARVNALQIDTAVLLLEKVVDQAQYELGRHVQTG